MNTYNTIMHSTYLYGRLLIIYMHNICAIIEYAMVVRDIPEAEQRLCIMDVAVCVFSVDRGHF